MRDIQAIDEDLQLRASERSSLRTRDGMTAAAVQIDGQIDELLDERLALLSSDESEAASDGRRVSRVQRQGWATARRAGRLPR
jgi:hypothetical protein